MNLRRYLVISNNASALILIVAKLRRRYIRMRCIRLNDVQHGKFAFGRTRFVLLTLTLEYSLTYNQGKDVIRGCALRFFTIYSYLSELRVQHLNTVVIDVIATYLKITFIVKNPTYVQPQTIFRPFTSIIGKYTL